MDHLEKLEKVIYYNIPEIKSFNIQMNPVTRGCYKGSILMDRIRYTKGMETSDQWNIHMKLSDLFESIGMETLRCSYVYEIIVSATSILQNMGEEDFDLWLKLR